LKKTFSHFSKAWVFSLRKVFQQDGAKPCAANVILDVFGEHLMIVLSQIVSLDILAMNGVGCHILPISTPGITIYGGI
jgi:hypothetical protein